MIQWYQNLFLSNLQVGSSITSCGVRSTSVVVWIFSTEIFYESLFKKKIFKIPLCVFGLVISLFTLVLATSVCWTLFRLTSTAGSCACVFWTPNGTGASTWMKRIKLVNNTFKITHFQQLQKIEWHLLWELQKSNDYI